MATYKEIFGKQVKFLSSDPDNEAEGQIWYNSTSNVFKSVLVTEAWSSGAPLTTARGFTGGFGTQDAALALGGSSPYTNVTEEYNGSGWAAGGTLNTTRAPYGKGGTGTQTAGLAVGGYTSTAVTNSAEEYDGTSWTAVTVYPASLEGVSGAGTQTAGVLFGGALASPYPGQTTSTEYDGTNWTASPGALNTARSGAGGAGTQTAAVAYGGYPDGPAAAVTTVEEYGGATWTAVNAMPVATGAMACWGTQTSAISAGGSTPSIFGTPAITTTMTYDGTDWTTSSAALATARGALGGAGASIPGGGVAFGGRTPAPAYVGTTEEFNKSATVITPGAWASGGALPTVLFRGASFGTLTAGANTGGDNTSAQPSVTTTSEYDGSTWTVGGVLATARRGLAASGVQTLGLAFGGSDGASDANVTGVTEEYGGTSWTTSPGSLNTARSALSGDGTQGASIAAGGYLGPPTANSDSAETYNGATWTAITNIPSVRRWPTTSGTTTAALVSGGETAPGTQLTTVSEWNGASWSEGGALLVTTSTGASAGTQTDALFFAGRNPSYTGAASGYDGTAWSTRPSMATARAMVGGSGVSTSAFVCGGETTPALVDLTEEFAGETSAANYKTITTS